MDAELFSELEKKVEQLLAVYAGLKHENVLLTEENHRLIEERRSFKSRIGVILEKLEGIEIR
jgi:regulator of replication initiation timing